MKFVVAVEDIYRVVSRNFLNSALAAANSSSKTPPNTEVSISVDAHRGLLMERHRGGQSRAGGSVQMMGDSA